MWINLEQELLIFYPLDIFFFLNNVINKIPDLVLHLINLMHQVIKFLDIILLLYHL